MVFAYYFICSCGVFHAYAGEGSFRSHSKVGHSELKCCMPLSRVLIVLLSFLACPNQSLRNGLFAFHFENIVYHGGTVMV